MGVDGWYGDRNNTKQFIIFEVMRSSMCWFVAEGLKDGYAWSSEKFCCRFALKLDIFSEKVAYNMSQWQTAANLKPDLDQRWHVDDSKVVEGKVSFGVVICQTHWRAHRSYNHWDREGYRSNRGSWRAFGYEIKCRAGSWKRHTQPILTAPL